MLITNKLDNLELQEVRTFDYAKLKAELGEFPRYIQYNGWDCEEVMRVEVIDGEEVVDRGWEIIGTNKLVEYQWTSPKAINKER